MSDKETEYEKSLRVQGFGFPEYFEKYYKDNMERNPDFSSSDDIYFEDIKNCQKYFSPSHNLTVRIVTSLESYIKIIDEFDQNYLNQIFYRGQTNANFPVSPTSLRLGRQKTEYIYFKEFERRFPEYMDTCNSTVEKLLFMQHYGLNTRILDVSEFPLVALYFACQEMIKFRTKVDADKNKWGRVFAYQVNRTPDKSDDEANKSLVKNYSENIKYYDSKTVSIMANCAKMPETFSLDAIERAYYDDGHPSDLQNDIYFKDLISSCVFVRTKQDNPRIRNQRGAFFIVNANEIHIYSDESKKTVFPGISSREFMDFALSDDKDAEDLSLHNIEKGWNKGKASVLKDLNEFNFYFTKVDPYSLKNSYRQFQTDPFGLKHYELKDKDEKTVVILIPPYCKRKIIQQLEHVGITEAFVYPDIDSVAYEINNRISEFLK